MLTFTDLAKQQVLAAMEEWEGKNPVLRLAVIGRGPAGFQYELGFIEENDGSPDDILVEVGPFTVYVDADSVAKLEGSTVDFVRGLQESGFKFDNPNSMWSDATAQTVQEVIDTQVNPAVASHGGFVTLLDVKDDTAFIALGGGCQGCGMADVTLRQGIEVMIKEAAPQIRQILDTTDHAAGTNPFYEASKSGESPLA